MAFFKFRKNGDEPSAKALQTESVEMMRKRAKHRLAGAAVLVLLGVVGFPLLVDKQPRPIPVDIVIEIPDKNKVKPLSIPAPMASAASASAGLSQIESKVAEAPIPSSSQQANTISQSGPKAGEKLAEKPSENPVEKVPLKVDESAKVQALLEGRDPAKKPDASTGRYVVQVGAFADATRAREVRLKIEHAGLKTYTHVADTKDGRRIRVRVGPFAAKADADKAVEQIKKLNLPAAILTL